MNRIEYKGRIISHLDSVLHSITHHSITICDTIDGRNMDRLTILHIEEILNVVSEIHDAKIETKPAQLTKHYFKIYVIKSRLSMHSERLNCHSK